MTARLRVVALIYPIERHVGHWATSSASIDLRRVIMEGDDCRERVLWAVLEHRPDAVAVIGKRVNEYLDLLDDLASEAPWLRSVPRVYRCQNTVLRHRVGHLGEPTRRTLAGLDAWLDRASDPRFSLVLVQTLDEVELIARAFRPTHVAACPYGYDPALFDPDLPELPRSIDVGCYFNLRDDARRVALVGRAEQICRRRGWTFRFVAGRYGQEYAGQIRTTRVCLHQSDQGEVPYRAYEAMALGSLFLTDPLRCRVETLFEAGREYLTFAADHSDLEEVLASVLLDVGRWETIRQAGKARARNYAWEHVAERYVAPALRRLLGR